MTFKVNRLTLVGLCGCMALLSVLTGCAIGPEVPPAPSKDLAEFEPTEYQTSDVEPMPAVDTADPIERDDGSLFFPWTTVAGVEFPGLTHEQVEALDALHAVGYANTQALVERNAQIEAINLEREALLRAGRLAEYEATLYHQLYSTEVRQSWLDGLMCKGVTGAALIFLAAGSL